MAKINTAHIIFRPSPNEVPNAFLGPREETLRGYDSAHFEGGMAIFHWKQTAELVMYPVDTIQSISSKEEE